MLQFTKRTEYGLIALIHLAGREGQVVSAREVGDHYGLPPRLLAGAFKDLQQAGIVTSQRGATGGYTLARPPQTVTLGEVIAALEGAPTLTSCEASKLTSALPSSACEVTPICPIKSPLHRIREGIWALLNSTTLRALVDSPFTTSELLAAPTD
ncbi:MAG: Rrf2 family nitric oxide-sensitive transcriptional repressor [Chlamydiales bacterium]|jgi:Rrf2 family nitric oxide-sensitive transcriptional repressor